MKIRITMTLDVDAEAWAKEYCLLPNEVREDVRVAITDMVRIYMTNDLVRSVESS